VKKKRFSAEQIVAAITEEELRTPVADLKLAWRLEYGLGFPRFLGEYPKPSLVRTGRG